MGWPSMTASASMPPTPQPTTPRPLIIVVWESVPTSCIGESQSVAAFLFGHHNIGQVFEIDLVHDAGHRRDDAEVAESLLPPLEELVSFAVALEFHFGIAVEGIAGGEEIHLDRMVDDQVHGDERVDLLRIAAEPGNGRAHGCQVDDGRHAGEILHHHAGRQKWYARPRPLGRPSGDVLYIILSDFPVIALAERRLEQNADRIR